MERNDQLEGSEDRVYAESIASAKTLEIEMFKNTGARVVGHSEKGKVVRPEV